MGKHQYDANAGELWEYYESVIKWIKNIFGNDIRKEMKIVDWGFLFNRYGSDKLDPVTIQKKA